MEKKLIIDASVSLKWIVHENELFCEKALAILQDFLNKKVILLVPTMWILEICNILPRKIENNAQVCEIFTGLQLYNIVECDLSLKIASIAFEIMREFPKVSFYDACYHALALKEGGVFVTADKKYYNMTKKKGGVIYLKDYKNN